MRQGQIFEFGDFQLDVPARTLRRQGTAVKLNARAFDVLSYLAQNPGKVLTRDELLKNVWADAFVDEHSLAQCISVLRRALEEKPGDNSHIVTLPGRGYQFVSEVRVAAADNGNTSPDEAVAGRTVAGGLVFQKETVETRIITRREEERSPISRGRLLVIALAAALGVAAIAAVAYRPWVQRRQSAKHELTERQLTANPAENSVASWALSRDGKFVAYTDFLSPNLYLLAIDTGELRQVPLPAAKNAYVVADWFPDGSHLLLLGGGFAGDVWKMSIWESSVRKLWGGNANEGHVSPDGSQIAFMDQEGGIWLMGADGEGPRKIAASEEYGNVAWSPTGQRLAILRVQGYFSKWQATIETCDLAGGARTVALSNPALLGPTGVEGIAWLPDGRIVYSIFSEENDSVLWTTTVDPSTGRASGSAKRLAGWKNFRATGPTASIDGKRLIVSRNHSQDEIYVANLAPGGAPLALRRFMPGGWIDEVEAWTKDSRAIVFSSTRNGAKWAIFKAEIDTGAASTLVAGPEHYWNSRLTSEGTLLYTASAAPYDPNDPTTRLMSTPLQGGARTTLMMGSYGYDCGSTPFSSCVVAEIKGKQLILSHLDPAKGRGEEIARLDGYGGIEPRLSLSPDSTRLAIVDPGAPGGEIKILNLADRKLTTFPVRIRGLLTLENIAWAADGKHLLFAETASASGYSLLSIDEKGNPRLLYELPAAAGWFLTVVPSPDGRYLALTKRTYANDVMLLENF